MGVSEYPLKRIYNFKGLSVRPSHRYPLKWILTNSSTHEEIHSSGTG